MNIEIDAETALKMFGIRDKSRKKKKASAQNSPEDISERMKCLPKLEDKEAETEADQEEKNARTGLQKLEEDKQNHESAKAHASERLHKFIKFLKGKKKEIEGKENPAPK